MKWLRLSGIFAVAVLLLSISSIRAWAVTTHYVRMTGSPCKVNHSTIQDAINHAGNGDTILVGQGVYSERITVNKDGLTIRSRYGPNRTFIRAPEPVQAAVLITGNGNRFIGFTVEDTSINGTHPHAHRLIFVQGDGNTISNNILRGRGVTSYADVGILVRGGGVGNGVASGNKIEGNNVSNIVNGILSVSVAPNNAAETTDIIGNTVQNCNQGIYIDRSPGCFVGENTVVSNGLGIGVRSRETTQGLSSAGTWLYGNLVSGNVVGALFVASDLVFVGDESNPNDFIANDIGILVTDEGDNVGTPDINYNNIEGNGVGLQNDSSQTVNAENNWWGDPDGPNVPNNPNYPTNGDTIEGTHWDIVDYDPWEPARL